MVAAGMMALSPTRGVPSAGPIAVKAGIREVTVYPDRAEVARRAVADLPAGASRVEFTGLPRTLEPDSLRVTAEGVPATLGVVELREEIVEPGESPELIAVRQELKKVEIEIAELVAAESNAADLKKFITSLSASTANREAERLAEGRADPAAIQGLYELIRARLSELSAASVARAQERDELEKRREILRARLDAVKPGSGFQSRVASVEVELVRAGRLSLELRYVSPGASWRPAYRAALVPDLGRAELVAEGVVTQTTGEDWVDIELHLSTASPVRGVRPPEVEPVSLRPADQVTRAEINAGLLEALPLLGRNYQDVLTLAQGFVDGISAEEDREREGLSRAGEPAGTFASNLATARTASIQRSAYNVSFRVPDRVTVHADGRDHRLALREDFLEGTQEYHAAPSIQPAAFLVLKTTSPGDYPLLAGPVRVSVGRAYLGSFSLEETAPGADLIMPFGVDNRVTVEQIPAPDQKGQSGLFGKERRLVSSTRSSIENRRAESIRIVLEERIPVAEDERIRVELGERTTPGWSEDRTRPGVKRWDLELKPGERREIELEYVVRFPRDLIILPVRMTP